MSWRCVMIPVLMLTYAAGAAEPISFRSLVREMVDLHRLTEMPVPHYKTVQFSSHDRTSNVPGGPNWFANADGFGNEPIPNFEAVLKEPGPDGVGEYLICDVTGPGAIVRTWTARIMGELRVYLDDAPEPILSGPAEELLLRGYRPFIESAGLDAQLLNTTFGQRNACYFPIPFAQRCRIVWIGKLNEVHFYEVQLRLYAAQAQVRTFQPQDVAEAKTDIAEVARILSAPQANWPMQSKKDPLPIAAAIEPGASAELLRLDGPAAIERLTLRATALDLDRALRQTVLHVYADEFPWGQVECPLGDFFGAAPGVNPMDTALFTVEPDGTMTCRLVMPFAKSLRIVAENRGPQRISLAGSALPIDRPWNDATSMHLRARWRVDHELTSSNVQVQDLPFLIGFGQGRYVGTAVYLLNPCPIPIQGGNWWGEGDEKIFVDDDVRPSTFGTGSEDYFNYAWSSDDIFIHPYCGQPRNDGPGTRGFVTNIRWHVLDDLPFASRIGFFMELFSHETTPGFSYARLAYHYARPGLMDDHIQITRADLRPLSLPANWQPAARNGGRDAVFYQAEELITVGPGMALAGPDPLYSGDYLFTWRPQTVGQAIQLPFPVLKAGPHLIRLTVARRPSGGRFRATVNGQDIGIGEHGLFDLHAPHRTLMRNVFSPQVTLPVGTHTLELSYEGPSPAASTAQTPELGLDFVWVQYRP